MPTTTTIRGTECQQDGPMCYSEVGVETLDGPPRMVEVSTTRDARPPVRILGRDSLNNEIERELFSHGGNDYVLRYASYISSILGSVSFSDYGALTRTAEALVTFVCSIPTEITYISAFTRIFESFCFTVLRRRHIVDHRAIDSGFLYGLTANNLSRYMETLEQNEVEMSAVLNGTRARDERQEGARNPRRFGTGRSIVDRPLMASTWSDYMERMICPEYRAFTGPDGSNQETSKKRKEDGKKVFCTMNSCAVLDKRKYNGALSTQGDIARQMEGEDDENSSYGDAYSPFEF